MSSQMPTAVNMKNQFYFPLASVPVYFSEEAICFMLLRGYTYHSLVTAESDTIAHAPETQNAQVTTVQKTATCVF
jgi:hypothetical protein